MDGMRTLLIIVGFLVILAALGHGLWTIRKNSKNSRNNKVSSRQASSKLARAGLSAEQTQSNLDQSGFDEYGIGAVRTIKTGAAATKNKEVTATVKEHVAKQVVKAEPAKVVTNPKVQQPTLFEDDETAAVGRVSKGAVRKEPSMGVEQLPMPFDDREAKGEPNISSTDIAGIDEQKAPEIGAIEPEQATENKAVTEQIPMPSSEPTAADTVAEENPEQITKHVPEVITLYVSGDIQGAILLQTVTELGFKFGEMDIFHRHEDTSGKGPSLFSLANMYNPGVFNLDEIETFTTRGVALFMELPVPSDGHKAFTMMYNAANKIAEAMPRAAVLDGNRNPITKQSVQHTYQKIREFERRQHVADAARH